MAGEFISSRGLSGSRGGSGEPLVVLLHGLGANRAVWQRMIEVVGKHWPGRWMAPDLRGHGLSSRDGPYGYAMHAADIAELIADETGTGWFGPRVKDIAAFGVKIVWTADEEAKARELAQRPARVFATRAEAIDRFLKASGLFGLVDPASDTAASGITGGEGQWQVAADPRCFGAVGPSIDKILRLTASPLRLAAGENDPMVSLDQMRAIDPAARTFGGAAHNAHWETPERVWDFIAGNQ